MPSAPSYTPATSARGVDSRVIATVLAIGIAVVVTVMTTILAAHSGRNPHRGKVAHGHTIA